MPLREVTSLTQKPYKCFMCEQPPSVCGRCVDTGKNVGNGYSSQRIYLCVECVQDCLAALSLPRPKDAEAAIKRADKAVKEANALSEKVAELEETLNGVSENIVERLSSALNKSTTTVVKYK